MLPSSGHVTGIISAVALNFIVHELSRMVHSIPRSFVGQRTHVAQQFVIAVVRVEHRMRRELTGARRTVGQRVGGIGVERVDVRASRRTKSFRMQAETGRLK